MSREGDQRKKCIALHKARREATRGAKTKHKKIQKVPEGRQRRSAGERNQTKNKHCGHVVGCCCVLVIYFPFFPLAGFAAASGAAAGAALGGGGPPAASLSAYTSVYPHLPHVYRS